MKLFKISPVLLLIMGFHTLPAWAGNKLAPAFMVCYDFSCKTEQNIAISYNDWQRVTAVFKEQAESPYDERLQIKQAIAVMEQIVGNYTPTHRDVAFNWVGSDPLVNPPGQMDCIDESINTTTYITLFQQSGLLSFHSVLERAYRSSFFDQHWAAQIKEHRSGKNYVLDSWFEDNGEPPKLVQSDIWRNF